MQFSTIKYHQDLHRRKETFSRKKPWSHSTTRHHLDLRIRKETFFGTKTFVLYNPPFHPDPLKPERDGQSENANVTFRQAEVSSTEGGWRGEADEGVNAMQGPLQLFTDRSPYMNRNKGFLTPFCVNQKINKNQQIRLLPLHIFRTWRLSNAFKQQ